MRVDPSVEPLLVADKGTLVWEKLPGGNIKIRANGLDKEIVILPSQVLELSLEDTPALYASARPRWVRRERALAPAVATVELGEDDFPAPDVAAQPGGYIMTAEQYDEISAAAKAQATSSEKNASSALAATSASDDSASG